MGKLPGKVAKVAKLRAFSGCTLVRTISANPLGVKSKKVVHSSVCGPTKLGVVFLPSRLALLESNPEKKGFFLRKRSSPAMPNALAKAVLVSEGTGDLQVRIAFPTAIPPGDPPSVGDPIWSRDWPKEVYEGLDRFGTTFGERGGRVLRLPSAGAAIASCRIADVPCGCRACARSKNMERSGAIHIFNILQF